MKKSIRFMLNGNELETDGSDKFIRAILME